MGTDLSDEELQKATEAIRLGIGQLAEIYHIVRQHGGDACYVGERVISIVAPYLNGDDRDHTG